MKVDRARVVTIDPCTRSGEAGILHCLREVTMHTKHTYLPQVQFESMAKQSGLTVFVVDVTLSRDSVEQKQATHAKRIITR